MKHLFLVPILGCLPLVAMAGGDCPVEKEKRLAKEARLAKAINTTTDSQKKGRLIAEMADCRDTGWVNQKADMLMILRNRKGDETERKVRVRTLEVAGDGDKGLSIFDTPDDVKGTAVLTWSHSQKADEQWIFLPALKRVKKISSKNKSGPFMGSEFAYEDIASQEVDKYTYEYLRDEEFNGVKCYVVKRYPTYKYSGYKYQIGWIDQEHFNGQKIDYYDRKGALLKTLEFKKYRQYLGEYWRTGQMVMENHQTGKGTTLQWRNYQFGNKYSDRDFDRNTLKRVR